MPHDCTGALLKIGDKVTLSGTIQEITSEQPTFCNINMKSDEGMEPGAEGQNFALSARMVRKVGDA